MVEQHARVDHGDDHTRAAGRDVPGVLGVRCARRIDALLPMPLLLQVQRIVRQRVNETPPIGNRVFDRGIGPQPCGALLERLAGKLRLDLERVQTQAELSIAPHGEPRPRRERGDSIAARAERLDLRRCTSDGRRVRAQAHDYPLHVGGHDGLTPHRIGFLRTDAECSERQEAEREGRGDSRVHGDDLRPSPSYCSFGARRSSKFT